MLELGLVQGAEAARAHVHALFYAIHNDGDLLDIRSPTPVGPALGVADIMSKLRALAANFAFSHDSTSFHTRAYS